MREGVDGFEPKIVGFLCNWCAYSGADLAGVSRVPSSPCLRVIRVMCTGRVDPGFVFKALASGASACHVVDLKHAFVEDYVLAFFDATLRAGGGGLLDATPPYPEVRRSPAP